MKQDDKKKSEGKKWAEVEKLPYEEIKHFECCLICHPEGFSEDDEEELQERQKDWDMFDKHTNQLYKHYEKHHSKKELISRIYDLDTSIEEHGGEDW